MNRRGFLGSILVAAAAPAIVRADSLMRVIPRDLVILPSEQRFVTATFEGNQMLTVDQITREALKILEDNLKFMGNINAAYDIHWDRTVVRIAQ